MNINLDSKLYDAFLDYVCMHYSFISDTFCFINKVRFNCVEYGEFFEFNEEVMFL